MLGAVIGCRRGCIVMHRNRPRCVVHSVQQRAVQPSAWFERPDSAVVLSELHPIVEARRLGEQEVAYELSLHMPHCLFLTALYGSGTPPMELPPALRIGEPDGSRIAPDFGNGMAVIGVDLGMWSSTTALTIDDGAWFTIPSVQDGPQQWRPVIGIGRIVLPSHHSTKLRANVQLSSCFGQRTYHVLGIEMQLRPPSADGAAH